MPSGARHEALARHTERQALRALNCVISSTLSMSRPVPDDHRDFMGAGRDVRVSIDEAAQPVAAPSARRNLKAPSPLS